LNLTARQTYAHLSSTFNHTPACVESVVAVSFQSAFHAEMYQNDVFSF